MRTWEKYSEVRFTGWNECPPTGDYFAGIQIAARDENPRTHGLGTDLEDCDGLWSGGFPSWTYEEGGMILNFTYNNWDTTPTSCASPASRRQFCIKANAIHEFGHALGFSHEQNRDDRPGSCNQPAQGTDGDTTVGQWDGNSVMNYCAGYRTSLSQTDIEGLQRYYGSGNSVVLEGGGTSWGSGNYTTGVALGDVDGDGLDEVGVARKAASHARFYIYDDANHSFALMHSGGWGWGSTNYATSIAFGDVDGDGRDEVGVARKTGVNERYYVLDDSLNDFDNFDQVSGGTNWGSTNYATSIAFGDVDGDGRDEMGVARNTNTNGRFYVFEDSRSGFALLPQSEGGHSWGDTNYATSIAFGDVDGDGRDEFGVARKADVNDRFYVYDDEFAGFQQMLAEGDTWKSYTHATSIAFGDIDDDGRDEFAVGKEPFDGNAPGNYTAIYKTGYYVYEYDPNGFFRTVDSGSRRWTAGVRVPSVAMGDIDGDDIDEIGFTREGYWKADYFVLDDALHNSVTFGEPYTYELDMLVRDGFDWGNNALPTSIAFGNVDSDPEEEFVVGRSNNLYDQFFVMQTDACHTGTNGQSTTYCTPECPCNADGGDCDADADCADGLHCEDNIGARYGFAPSYDVCVP